MKLSSQPRHVRAFTIVEVIIASFLLSAGIAVILSFFSASHRNSLDSQRVIIASELAQEGVEVARNIRDNNSAYRLENWSTGDMCQTSTSGNCDPFRYFPVGVNRNCTASYDSTDFTCPPVSLELVLDGSGLYKHAVGTSTRYYRLIKIDHTASDTARVQSFVAWQNPGSNLNGGGAINWCTATNKCVYTELFLSAWK